MALRVEHELHNRRRSRNVGLLVVLVLFVLLIFGLSIVKITNGNLMEGFDHQPRTSLLPLEGASEQGQPQSDAQPLLSQDATGGQE